MLLINTYNPAYRIDIYAGVYDRYKKGAKKPLKLLEIVFNLSKNILRRDTNFLGCLRRVVVHLFLSNFLFFYT